VRDDSSVGAWVGAVHSLEVEKEYENDTADSEDVVGGCVVVVSSMVVGDEVITAVGGNDVRAIVGEFVGWVVGTFVNPVVKESVGPTVTWSRMETVGTEEGTWTGATLGTGKGTWTGDREGPLDEKSIADGAGEGAPTLTSAQQRKKTLSSRG